MAVTRTVLPKVAPFAARDIDPLFKLYAQETRCLAHCPIVRRHQFEADLMTPRFLRGPENYDPRASIQLVVRSGSRPIAYASGCKTIKGDEVTAPHEGFVRFVLADPTHRHARENVRAVVRGVVRHLRRFKPRKIKAFDYCMAPCFFHLGSGLLPIEWAWIGQCLQQEGFVPGKPAERLYRPLKGRGFVPRRPRIPRGIRFKHHRHEHVGVNAKYDFGVLLFRGKHAIGWCGNFFSGGYVRGTGMQYVFTNWYTIFDDKARGQGLGRLLLRYVLHAAASQGARHAILQTDTDNFVAQNLYRSEGFEPLNTVFAFEKK